MLDVHRALLDARTAVHAGPQHVGVDHPALFGGADQGAGGLLGPRAGYPAEAGLWNMVLFCVLLPDQVLREAALGRALERALFLAKYVGRLGHPVVAQIHDDELGRQRLTGVPGRALRLTASTLGTGGEVEVALPGEVLDLAPAEFRVVRRVFEVDRLAVELDRQQRTQAVGQPLEGDVDRRQEDVQVLGVQHDDQEDKRHADVRQQCDRLDPFVGSGAQRMHELAHAVREERAPAVGEVPGVDRRAAEDGVAEDDQEDHEQDQPRAAGVRAVEP